MYLWARAYLSARSLVRQQSGYHQEQRASVRTHEGLKLPAVRLIVFEL